MAYGSRSPLRKRHSTAPWSSKTYCLRARRVKQSAPRGSATWTSGTQERVCNPKMASPSPNCSVLQINLHHSITATAQLRKWLEVHPTALALIQDPWIRQGRICGFSNTGEFCSRDLCAISLLDTTTHQPKIVVASAYMPDGDMPPPPEELTRSKTIIDITLATDGVCNTISNWHVSKEASCSDHRWILFNLEVNTSSPTPRRKPRKTNPALYKTLMESRLTKESVPEKIMGVENIEKQVTRVYDVIKTCYHTACPLTIPPSGKPKAQPWWGPELERTKVRRLLNRAMNTGADCDWDRYKDWKQKYKKRIRYRSSGSWRKYTTGIECQHQANRVRKVLSNQPKQILGTLRRPDDTFTGSPEEAERLLLETHFPDCKFVQNMEWTEESTNANEENWAIAYRVVTTDKTRWAINTFHPFKSAGPDGVFPALLQWGGETLLALLTIIFRACLAHGYVPRGWREVKVIFIPKPGKCDYSNPRSYRPISLTSFVLKTLERLCEKELRENYLQKLPLHPNQHAYSQGKCTDSALQAVVSVIESAISDKGFCLGTFLDIEGAFDKTKFIKIKEALQRHGVCTTLRNWIGNMLQGRILLLVEGESQKAIVAKGCPQGGVISPLLWNMVVNDLITALNDHRYYTVGYADDLAILIRGKFVNTICEVTNAALRIVEKWCGDNGLSVNPAKTELVMFTNNRIFGNYKLPKLFNTELQLANEVKYLGVILDSKLNWGAHLDAKLSTATISFWQCRRMIGKTWGLSPKIVLWLYTAVIRPIICYGAVVWWPRTKLITARNKLQSFQRLACLAITGAMRTTPTAALEVMLNLPALHLFIRQEAASTAVRLKTLHLWKGDLSPQAEVLNEVMEKEPMLLAVSDKLPKQFVFDKKYKIQLHEDPNEALNTKDVRIFTDGSKTVSGTGYGVFSEDLNIQIAAPLGAHNTVYQAECMGIIAPASATLVRKVKNYSIRILSDSRSVLQALQSHSITSRLIYNCHQSLMEVCNNNNNVTLQWIKGHSGSRGNDAADEMARRGSVMAAIGPEPIVPLPTAWPTSVIRQHTKELHNKYWMEVSGCRQAKQALPHIDRRLSRKLMNLTRPHLRKITHIITGHGPFNKHLFNVGVTDSPLCRACLEAEETAAHIILECTGVTTYRARHLGSPRTLSEVIGDTRVLFGCTKYHEYIYGQWVTVKTDHKPLITLFKKALYDIPPRLQRIMLRLQPYNLNVVYKPGKYLYIADTLSRAALNETCLSEVDQDIDLHVNLIMSNLTVIPEKLKELQEYTVKDQTLSQIMQYCLNGWPEHKRSVSQSVKYYFNLKDQLYVIDNIVFKSNCIIIPESMRDYILQIIHSGHQGVNASIRLAKTTVYWPNMHTDIEKYVSQCNVCLSFRRNNSKEPIIQHEYENIPWYKVGVDIFKFERIKYLIVVDYYSKYVELAMLRSGYTASIVITQIKSILARHGICRILISDNGPPFNSKEFSLFTKEWDIEHITSSPYLSRANGLVERSIGTIKNMLRKCKTDMSDMYLALLLYRNTPKLSQYSPAELSMSRKLRTIIPTVKYNLKPRLCDVKKVQERNERQKSYSKFYYNKHTKILKPLAIGEKVFFKHKPEDKNWLPGVISQVGPAPRSYVIDSEKGKLRRNRQFILKQSGHTPNSEQHTTQSYQHTTQSQPVSKIRNTVSDPQIHQHSKAQSRYGRVYKPVNRYGFVT
ncbi:unnamed protein product [Euphydryas editha]|uniref:RNA-directed DNA polymerase n=1 Tax=Euphydryas editha TaxID=104508 RepID=A0AAU9VEN6_EUPED|nr:unnamed protein product [Euphydryas editha]